MPKLNIRDRFIKLTNSQLAFETNIRAKEFSRDFVSLITMPSSCRFLKTWRSAQKGSRPQVGSPNFI